MWVPLSDFRSSDQNTPFLDRMSSLPPESSRNPKSEREDALGWACVDGRLEQGAEGRRHGPSPGAWRLLGAGAQAVARRPPLAGERRAAMARAWLRLDSAAARRFLIPAGGGGCECCCFRQGRSGRSGQGRKPQRRSSCCFLPCCRA